MAYEVRLKPSVVRTLKKLPAQIRARIGSRLDAFAGNPRPPGCEKLGGVEDLYRVRVGDYRIVYRVSDEFLLVLVVTIGHRGDVYRRL